MNTNKYKFFNNKYKIFYGLITLIWMGVIFIFSSQDAIKSTQSSSLITEILTNILSYLNILDKNNLTPQDIQSIHGIIRVGAHFVEYVILGIFSSLFIFEFKTISKFKSYVGVLLFCILYSISDEIHQIYVPGRTCDIFDVFIDTLGSISGIGIVVLAKKRFTKSKNI